MIKTYKSSLQLNSYKLDTQGFEERLKILTHENAQLKTSIHSLKLKENHLYEELKITKQQNNTLRIKLRNESAQQESQCRNCSRFADYNPARAQKNVERLEQQLQRERERANQFKQMYENQLQNKKDAAQYYQKKLHALLRDKDMLVKKYQEKIKQVSSQTSIQSQPNIDSTTSLERHFSPKKTPLNDSLYTQATQPTQSIPSQPQTQPALAMRKFPPSPQRINQRKGPQSIKAIARKPTEETLDALLIPFLQRLEKMNLSLKELRFIQQIDRFSQGGLVAKNKYIKLLREFPFQCEDQDAIQVSFEFVSTNLRGQGMEETGVNIVNLLIDRMKDLQE